MIEGIWEWVSMYVCKRETGRGERFCYTEQICRAKVKVTAGLLPARGRGNLNQQHKQHKRALKISSLGVKWKMLALLLVWIEIHACQLEKQIRSVHR